MLKEAEDKARGGKDFQAVVKVTSLFDLRYTVPAFLFYAPILVIFRNNRRHTIY